MSEDYEMAVDFMDMTNDRRLWARAADARARSRADGGPPHLVVCDEDADSKVARIVAFDAQTGTSSWRSSRAASSPTRDLLAPA